MAFPTFQAAGTAVSSVTDGATIAPAWPTHQSGDVGLLIVESSGWGSHVQTPQGFKEVPSSPRGGVGAASGGDTQLTVYWKRATGSSESAPTVLVGARYVVGVADPATRAVIVTFRGCAATGNPWNVCHGDILDAPGGATLTIPGVTTSDANCLAVLLATSVTNSQGVGALSNSSLANIVKRLESASSVGGGSYILVATGEKAVAGAISATTGTLTNSARQARMILALTSVAKSDDKTPWLWARGLNYQLASAGNITPAWPPGHQSGDLGLLVVESGGWPVATPSGWTALASSPQQSGISGAADGTSLYVWYKRATSGAEAAPSIAFVSSQIQGTIFVVRDAPPAGNPIEQEAGDAVSSTTTVQWPAVTTLRPNGLILHFLNHSLDSISKNFNPNSVANSNLVNPIFDIEYGSDIGSGSSISLHRALKPTAGATGNTTQTLTNSQRQTRITVAITPAIQSIDLVAGAFTIVGTPASLLNNVNITAADGAFVMVGTDANLVHTLNHRISAEMGSIVTTGTPASFDIKKGHWQVKGPVSSLWTKAIPRS